MHKLHFLVFHFRCVGPTGFIRKFLSLCALVLISMQKFLVEAEKWCSVNTSSMSQIPFNMCIISYQYFCVTRLNIKLVFIELIHLILISITLVSENYWISSCLIWQHIQNLFCGKLPGLQHKKVLSIAKLLARWIRMS